MSLLGSAALAMWWDISPDMRTEFEHWHTHEHFVERLSLPGFLRASRWRRADDTEGFFVLYELADHGVLSSAPYLARLNAPTPWSTRLMPHHRNMVRAQCRVLESSGSAIARHALTVRLSPGTGRDDALRAAVKELAARVCLRAGLVGAHLLRHEAPAMAITTEQRIRGGDREADLILVVTGYDARALEALCATELNESSLLDAGASPAGEPALYTLSHSATPTDVGQHE
jgi:hypothetical protein